MITFQESKPQQDPVDDIIVCDQKVGKVEIFRYPSTGAWNYHASLHVGGQLLQGFASSKLAAVLAALETGKNEATKLLSEIEALTKLLDTKEEDSPDAR